MKFSEFSKSFTNWRFGQAADDNVDEQEFSKINVKLIALEERVLYSAAPLPVDLVDLVDAVVVEQFEQFDFVENTELNLEIVLQAIDTLVSADQLHGDLSDLPLETSLSIEDSHVATSGNELVVVDTSVEDYQQLVENLVRQSAGERSFEIVYIDAESNGVSQVSDFLGTSNQIFGAIHLVTHGSDGQIQLGDSLLNVSALSTFANQLETWNSALTENADLVIYGCDVAQTELGEKFVSELAELIGVDVAASDDVTGHTSLSGDWNFEYQVGIIESTTAFTQEVQAGWLHDLAIAAFNGSSEDGSASRAVAASDGGEFVGVFSTDTIAGSVGADIYYELHTQLDLIDGNPATTIRVNDTQSGDQQWATVAMAANGDMTFVWTSDHSGQLGVYGKIIDSDGTVIKTEFEIDQGNGGHNASIAMDKLGNFIVVWESSGDGDVAGDIYGQMFDAFGNTIDSTFQVNTGEANAGDTSGYQGRADVAMNESNEFVVSWDNYFDSDTESEIFANKYEFNASTVTSLTGEFLVQGAISTQLQFSSSVDINDNGDFVVAWTVDGSDSLKAAPFGVGTTATALSTEVHGSTFLANGTLEHNFTNVNSSSQGDQEHPSVALLNNNVVVFVWEGESTLSSDQNGVFQRAYNFDGTQIDAVERFVSPLADAGVQTNVTIDKYLNNDYVIGFAGILDGTEGYHIVATTAQAIQNVPEGLVYSTTGPGSLGPTSWDQGDAIGFGDPLLTFGSPTDGQAYVLFDTSFDLDAIHVVTQYVTIDTAIPTALYAGDILFSIEETNTSLIPGIATAYDHDILIFRPSAPGNYDFASGSFSVLVTLPAVDDIWGFTLVQSDTTVGDYDLSAGDILFTSNVPFDNDIQLLQISGGVQSIDVLIDGDDVGVDESIMGIELIEEQTTIGGVTLNAGTLLLSAERNETVGEPGALENAQSTAGGLTIQDNDIYALDFSTATLGITGSANATASLFFDGSTVAGLIGGPTGDVDAISLVSTPIVNFEESLDVNNGMTVDEGGSLTITNSELLTTDTNDASTDLVYTITSAPAYGTILLSGSPTLTFTQDDIDAGRVSYQHDGTETPNDWFDFSVDDGQGTDSTDTFNITINPINDNPIIAVNDGMTVNEGQPNAVISAGMLSVVDDDDGSGELTFTILNSPVNGTLYLDSSPLVDGSQFTQTDIMLGRLSYSHDGSETDFDSFLFSAIDGGEDGTIAQVGTFEIFVTEVNDAPTDLSPGIQLNMDSGNDAYFEAAAGDILAGLNEFTIELTFSAPYAPATHLFSYETAAGDDVEIALMGDGRLHLEINNTSAGLLTGIDYNTLMDGSNVNFAFSWDNANGAWAVMVDGVVTDSGIGLEVGQTLASGGRLIFGMDQDSPGGGFLSDEIFSGTLHDIRLWNEVRTAEEIVVNKNHKFEADNLPAGLIANWQMTDLVGGTTIVDLINPGTNDLTLGHAGGVNFVTSTPTDSLNVDENSVNGTIVGHVVPTDIEYGDDVVAGGLFLNADWSNPDLTTYAADGSWAGNQLGDWAVVFGSVDVKGSDWESSPLGGRPVDLTGNEPGILEQTIVTEIGREYTINFALSGNFQGVETSMDMAVNVDGVANNFTYVEQPGWGVSNLMWQQQSLTFIATSTTTVLQFESLVPGFRGALIGDVQVLKNSTAGNGIFSFDMTDDSGGRFVIDSLTGEITVADQNGLDFETNTSHTVTIEVRDPAGDTYVQNVDIYINDVNEAPTLPVNTGMTVSPASTGTVIASSMLNANDVDVSDIPSQLFYTIDASVNVGSLWLSGVELFNGNSFTQQDINDGNLTYNHTGAIGTDSFGFTLADGGEGGVTNVSGTFSIAIANVEEVISTNTTLTVDEGFAATITDSFLETTDADGTAALVVYTITSGPGEGTILVSGVPATSFTQADINAGIVSYAHDGNESSSDVFGFSVDDGYGTATTGSFLITIDPVNDEESLDVYSGQTVDEGDSVVITKTQLETSDVDNLPSEITYTITNSPSYGTILVSGSPVSSFTQADIDAGLVSYSHNGSEPASDSFDFDVDDGLGTVTPGSFNITIQPVNDEESVVVTLVPVAVDEGGSTTLTDSHLSASDNDHGAVELVFTITIPPINGVILVNGSPSTTFTQLDIDNNVVSYLHNGTETLTDTVTFSVDDGEGTSSSASLNFAVNPVNDAPDLINNSGMSISEGDTGVVITTAMLFTDDVDDTASGLTYTVDRTVANGTLFRGLTQLNDGGTFTQADIDLGLITYHHDGSEPTGDSFDFTVADGGEDGASADSDRFYITIAPQNDAPVAGDNVYGVAHGESVNIAIDRGLIYNDVDADGDALAASISTGPLHGFVTINPDGTFTYTHDGTTTTTDFFSYQVTDGFLVDTATVEIHIDSSGFENTDEFLVNQGTVADPIGNIQSNSQTNRLGNAAVDARDNGDYVVTWSSEGADGSNDVFVRLFDFSGTPLTDQIQVNSFETDEQFGSSVAMAKDGSFVVTWMSENQDGSGSSIYMRQFNADGTSDMPSEVRVSEAFYSVGEQRNPTISMNSLGQFTIAWDGANAGGSLHDVYARSFDADGTALRGTVELTSTPIESEYNASVIMFDDGSLFTVWDENNRVFVRRVTTGGTLGVVVATPVRTDVLETRHSSLDTNADGLVALAYQTKVSDGLGVHWDVHLHVFDPSNPVIVQDPGHPQFTSGGQINPDVVLNDDGSILMTWQGQGAGDANDIFVRQFIVETDENGDYIAQATSDEYVVTQTTAGAQAGSSIAALDSENFVVVWMGNGAGDTNGVFARQYGNQDSYEASGNVLEDVNGDSGLADATAVEDAEVHLYRDDGDGVINANDQLVRVTSTDVDGKYTFAGLDEGATYWVVVDSKTIHRSAATNGGYTYNDVWAQQTFGDGGAKFGGLNAEASDDATSLMTAQHVSKIDVFGNVTDVDFGFSFNVVTNTLAGDAQDDDAGANQRSVQGSLRQFMTNANAIDGDNEMRFVPVGAANRTAGTDAWWEISVSRALPAITDEGTTIDGRAYRTDGVTLSNSNSSIHGYVGSVGVGADGVAGTGDEVLLTGLDAPELEISDVAGIANGITVNASNVEISHVSIQGFGRSGFSSGNIFVEAAGEYVYIHHNIIGADADSFTSPATAASQFVNIQVEAADNGLIADNLIGFSASTGIQISGTSDYADDAHGWTITGNEIRSNGLILAAKDGIDLQYEVVDISIVANLIAGNSGYGIDSWRGSGGYTIADNTIMGNGIGGDETGGIRLFGSGSEVQHNLITSNTGSGVNIVGDYSNGSTTFTASTGNLVTQNSFSGNSGNSIDLMSSTNVPTILEQGDGVSANGSTSDIGAGNLGLDYPELNYVEFQAGQLLIAGRISPSLNIDRIEFYLASAGAGDSWGGQSYGEGQTYLGTLPVSSLTLDGVTGEFSGILPPPFPGAFSLNPVGQQVTAIAIDTANNTSEFGNDITPNVAPTAVDSNILMDEDSVHIFNKIEFGFTDTSGDTLERVRIDSLPSSGTLLLNGVALTTTGVEVSVAQLDAGNLSYRPSLDSNGLPLTTFDFSVNDGDTYSLTSASFEVHVTPVNDQPTGTGESFSTAEDALLVVDLSSPENLLSNISDVDGDSLTVITTPITGPANGTLLLGSDGTFSYLPDLNFNGSDSFMYEVVDGNGGSIVATATITITPVNNAPVLTDPGVVVVAENTTHVVNLTSTDVDGDSPTYSIAGTGADDAQFDLVGNELVFLTAPDFESPLGSGGNTYFVDVRVDDGNSGFDVRTIEIVVSDVLDNPEGFDDSFWVDEAGLYTSTTSVLDNDLDRLGDGLTASILVQPTHGSVSMNPDGNLTYQHDGSESPIDNFVYIVVGADGQVDTAEVTINVNPIQDPTIVNDDGIFAVAPDETVVITAGELLANDFDPDSTDLQIVLVDSPVDGIAFIDANGNLVFDPGASFSGLEVLEYVVVADGVTSDVATVTFDVLATVGIPPVEEVEPEDETPDSEIIVSESPPPSDGGSTVADDVGDVPLASFADTTADTVQSESSEPEIDPDGLIFELERQQTTYAYANDTNNLSLENAVGFGRLTAASGLAISTFDPVMAGIFWNDLDAAKEEFLLKFDLTTPTIVASVTSFLTVGYLAWIIRGGVLLTTFMSSVPAWQAFDPLPVIESAARDDDEDDQSIAQMIDSQ